MAKQVVLLAVFTLFLMLQVIGQCEACTWSEWTYTACNVPCGNGTRNASRLLTGNNCHTDEPFNKTENCNMIPCKNSTECVEDEPWCALMVEAEDTGVIDLASFCEKKVDGAKLSWYCPATCKAGPCTPVNCTWSDWNWTPCSATCNNGTQNATRTVVQEAKNGGLNCTGNSSMTVICGPDPCPVNCTWTAWGSFGQCSKTCGGGYKVRTRFVDQEEMYNGTCLEPASDIENCNSQLCEVNCTWSAWSSFGNCSKMCGGGYRVRTRFVEQGTCHELSSDIETCNTELCEEFDTNGTICNQDEDFDWTDCSATCGDGFEVGIRINQGEDCTGDPTKVRDCNLQPCPDPVDCVWAEWQAWSSCSKTCNGGTQLRFRGLSEGTKRGGACPGASTEQQPCSTDPCNIPVFECFINSRVASVGTVPYDNCTIDTTNDSCHVRLYLTVDDEEIPLAFDWPRTSDGHFPIAVEYSHRLSAGQSVGIYVTLRVSELSDCHLRGANDPPSRFMGEWISD